MQFIVQTRTLSRVKRGHCYELFWQGELPGSSVVKTSSSSAGGVSLIPGQGAKIPHASQPLNRNLKNYYSRSIVIN